MKNYKNIFRIISITLLLITLYNCKGDDIIINTDLSDSKTYEANLPIVKHYKATLKDLIEHYDDERLYIDEQGVVNFSVKKDVDVVWNDLADMKDINLQKTYSMSDHEIGGNKYRFDENLSANSHEDARYDSAHIADGMLRLSFRVPIDYKGELNVTLPQFRPTITRTFYADGININEYRITVNTKDHKLIFNHEGNNSIINVELEADFETIGDPNSNLTARYQYRDVTTNALFGYFGQRSAELKDQKQTIDDVKSILEYVSFELDEIKYSLNSTNYIGAPFDVHATNIRFYKAEEDEEFELLLVDGKSEIKTFVESPKYSDNIVPTFSEVVVDSKTSNVLQIANPFPEKIIADIIAISNPQGEEINKPNYYTGYDTLFAELKIEAPLTMKIKEFSRKDTIDFDFRDMVENKRENAEIIEMASIYINLFNFLPFDVEANLYVIDKDGNKLDDIFTNYKQILESGDIVNGKLNDEKVTEIIVELTKKEALLYFDKNAYNLVLETRTSSKNHNADFVKIYEHYGLGAKISVSAKSKLPNID